jgi:hypothetical protein
MRLHRALMLVGLVAFAAGCDSKTSFFGDSPTPSTVAAADANRPDAPPSDVTRSETPAAQASSAFVPMADDLIVRLDYGAEMDGPGWYRVMILDPDFPTHSACETTMETSSEEGLSAYGSEDYLCYADVFNANSTNRTDPDQFVIYITNSHGNELSYPLTWQGGSFTNEVGNVISYQVP